MKKTTILNVISLFSLMILPQFVFSQEGPSGMITDKIAISGVVELEASSGEDKNVDYSDVSLATVEFGLDADLNDNVSGHLLFLFEEGGEGEPDTKALDEGTITVKFKNGMSLIAGRMYIPFGAFNSHFISDPLTLELGETNETALLLSRSSDLYGFSVGFFNGDVREVGDDDELDDVVASLSFTPVKDITIGASYISDIADTDGDITGAAAGGGTVTDSVAGYSAFISATVGPVTIEAEYLAAAEEFDVLDLDIDSDGNGDEPSTFNVEIAYSISEAAEIALRYEGAEDLELEKQYGIAYSRELYENTSFALEYISGEYENDDDRTVVTAQLGIEF